MNTRRRARAKAWMAAAGIVCAAAFASSASAGTVRIEFSSLIGLGSGYATLTLGTAAADDSMFDPTKPPKAIINATGSFNGVAITGVQPLNNATPPPGEKLPESYSLFEIPGYGDHDGISYNNLYYPLGSPEICFINGVLVYPFSGGIFDLMGTLLTLADDTYVDLFSFGDMGKGIMYGLKLIKPLAGGGFEAIPLPPPDGPMPFATLSVVSVPEPAVPFLFGAAMLGVFAWRRSTELRRQPKQSIA